MKQKPIPPPKINQSPQKRFERFVSALIRVPKKEVDEKEAIYAKKRMENNLAANDKPTPSKDRK